jgi:hypothetical protein
VIYFSNGVFRSLSHVSPPGGPTKEPAVAEPHKGKEIRTMRTILAFAASAALLTAGLAAPTAASASGCTNTGTVVGGLAGALIGNGIASGGGKTGGTIIGGLGGAVAGHEIAKRNCNERRVAERCRWNTYRDRDGQRHRVHQCQGQDGRWYRN